MNEQLRIKQIDITPDRSLIPKIGQAGYSASQAISELVDNSIDAKNIEETLHVIITLNKDFVEVEDDGRGMNEAIAEKCLKLAHSEKRNQLGEFGLGLKTSCQSLGKSFRVTTTQKGNNEEYVLEFDEEKWIKDGDWKSHPMIVRKAVPNKSGTSIRVEKLRIKFYPNLVTNIKEDLSLRFGPYISNGELILKVNDMICKPGEIELTEEGKKEFSFKLSNGNAITGWIGLMKSGYSGNKGYYGFNTYRRGRLITQYDKIGFTAHPEYRRIAGELHMDSLPVTHNKREWIKEAGEYLELEKEMKEVVKPFLAKARKYETTIKVNPVLEEKMQIQEDIIARAIKNTPELKQYALPNAGLEEKKKGKTDVNVEKREHPEVSIIQEVKEPESERDRTPKRTHKKRKYELMINGKKFRFNHEFRELDDKNLVKQIAVTQEKGIEIFTNISFPAFSATKDSIFYATLNIAEGIAEVITQEKGEDKKRIFEIRDLILRRTAEIMRSIDEEKRLELTIKENLKKLEKLKGEVIE